MISCFVVLKCQVHSDFTLMDLNILKSSFYCPLLISGLVSCWYVRNTSYLYIMCYQSWRFLIEVINAEEKKTPYSCPRLLNCYQFSDHRQNSKSLYTERSDASISIGNPWEQKLYKYEDGSGKTVPVPRY